MTKEKTVIKGRLIGANIIIAIIVLAVVAIIIFGRGKTTVTGEHSEPVADVSLSCDNTGLTYPFFRYDNSLKKTTIIKAIFSKDEVKSISLSHELFYNNAEAITGSEAHNRAAMGIKFGSEGMEADSYSANYLKTENSMRMTLFADSSDMASSATYKYFLLNRGSSSDFPHTAEEYKTNYENQGFSCTIK